MECTVVEAGNWHDFSQAWLKLVFAVQKLDSWWFLLLPQEIRHQMCPLWPEHRLQRLGAACAGQHLSPRLLLLLLLQTAAVHWGGMWTPGKQGLLSAALWNGDGKYQTCQEKRWVCSVMTGPSNKGCLKVTKNSVWVLYQVINRKTFLLWDA